MNNLSTEPVLTLAGVDWAAAWTSAQKGRDEPGNAAHWTKRSASYGDPRLGDYERAFLERAGIEPGETVLDFGCGIGLLAVPLAQMGCRVVACDFSAGMLDELARYAASAGVADAIDARLVAWDDDWEAAGIAPESCDVAIASRSIATSDMLGALRKLDRTARRRVCVTVAAGRSPRRDERAYEAVGRRRAEVFDYAYCTNILFQHGVFPELSYIVTHSRPAFADRESAVRDLSAMVGGGLTPWELSALEAFLDEHYAIDPSAKPGRTYASDALRTVRWAFVSWDRQGV